MPVYSYKCNRCKKVTDVYRHVEDRVFPKVCECGGFASRSFVDEAPKSQVFEPYWDIHLANDDHPDGRMCTGYRQKAKMMREMNFEYRDSGRLDPTKREMEARRHGISLKKHFVGAGKT